MRINTIVSIAAALTLLSCQGKKQAEVEPKPPVGIEFNADSAFAFCAEQCAFGPRTMNSTAHTQCEQWIIGKFQQYGCQIMTQKADLRGWDGTTLHATNIMARLNPEAKRRIMLCAHWDSRPWADNDPIEANRHTPVMAANDGASGVAVMLEIARALKLQSFNSSTLQSSIGLDFLCLDAEDYGTPQWHAEQDEASWALGAQYFAKNPSTFQPFNSSTFPLGSAKNFNSSILQSFNPPKAAILLDMVGGQGARFYQEGFSREYAQDLLDQVWQAASDAGYGSTFPRQRGGYVTDDHKPLNEAGIPCIDIIPYYPDCPESSFGPTWHTLSDDLQHLDRQTLKAVGQTLLQFIAAEP